MRERTLTTVVSLGAATFLGDLFVVSRSKESAAYTPEIVSQERVRATTKHPEAIRIVFQNAPAFVRRVSDGSEAWQYRIRDARGRVLAQSEGNLGDDTRDLLVPLGYGRTPLDLRLETLLEGGVVASTPLASFPAAVVRSPPSDAMPRLRAFAIGSEELARRSPEMVGRSALRFEPVGPLRSEVGWQIEICETPSQRGIDASAVLLRGRFGTTPSYETNFNQRTTLYTRPEWILTFPYADEATAVRVRGRPVAATGCTYNSPLTHGPTTGAEVSALVSGRRPTAACSVHPHGVKTVV